MVRRNRRRYRSRSRKTLSTRRIFSRTSAKAQASQIYALRRKINSVYRRTMPQTKIVYVAPTSHTFTNEALSNAFWTMSALPVITIGSNNDQRVGDKLRSSNLTIYLNWEYGNNLTSLEATGATCRVIVCQYKTSQPISNLPSATGLFQQWGSGATYDLIGVGPLKEHLSQYVNVLKDIRFTMDENKCVRQMKLNIRPNNLRYNEGDFNNVYIAIAVGGLHWVASADMEYVDVAISTKFAFTDA